MKKLIIAITAIACAVAVNAASVDWGFQEQALDKNSPVDISSYTAYLFTATDWEAAVGAGVSATTFASAKSQSTSAFTKTTGGSGANTWTKWATGNLTWTDDDAASGNYYVVISDGKQYAASDAIAATAYASTQEAHTASLWQIAANKPALTSGSFTAVAPEPTSGLLLRLGMAGLALKRKRA